MAAAAAPSATVGPRNDLTDVEGLRVGHAAPGPGMADRDDGDPRHPAPSAASTSGAEVPARETDALAPWNLVPHVHAVCLTGEQRVRARGRRRRDALARGAGHRLPDRRRPGTGGAHRARGRAVRPGPRRCLPAPARRRLRVVRGRAAGRGRRSRPVVEGTVGAGTGAAAGGVAGGSGSASAVLPDGTTVAALVAVNAAGAVFDAETGVLHAAPLLHRTADPRLRRPTRGDVGAARRAGAAGDDEHDDRGRRHGPRSVAPRPTAWPVPPTTGWPGRCGPHHLLTDGDTFFGLATGTGSGRPQCRRPRTCASSTCCTRRPRMSSPGRSRGVLAARSHGDRPPTGTCSRHRRRPGTSDQVVASLT